ncbi:hypothetical protein EDB83DRAFT_2190226, partial [Lactarius deliciosus]
LPVFSFFLSTTGKITQFGQPRGQDKSNCINDSSLTTPCPYIHLGFNQLMQSQKILDQWTTLDHIISLECIAHMGWLLWGTHYDHGNEDVHQSIIYFTIYTVLSQCLALDINTPQYLFDLSSPLNAMRTMHEQIANHVHVCMAVGSGIESLYGNASSEPILSEVVSIIMLWPSFNFPHALLLVLMGFSIDQGDCGELLVATFFTWARDQVIHEIPTQITREKICHHFQLTVLFGKLFTESTYSLISGNFLSLCSRQSHRYICHTKSQRSFEEAFKKANMHFNQVIKPQVQKLLAHQFLLYFMAHGAATLGANCQPRFNAIYLYLYGSLDLNIKNVGFIIVQVKNDSSASGSDYASIFKKMDPFKCGLLNDSDKVNRQFLIPIIY